MLSASDPAESPSGVEVVVVNVDADVARLVAVSVCGCGTGLGRCMPVDGVLGIASRADDDDMLRKDGGLVGGT